MKRTAKILLSAMLVLMFVFSFAGAVPAAWADYTETGAITSDNAVFLWNEETEAYDSYTGEVAIDFGKDSDNHPISYISSIKEYGISFLVPDGLYVEKVTLEAQGQLEGEKVLDLSKYAVLDGSALKIPASAFENKADGSNILDVLGGSRTYVFSVFFRSVDPDAQVEVTYTDGSLEGVLGTLVEGGNTFQSDKEGHTVLPLSDSVTPIKSYHKEFAGWKLVYENGISTEVSVGSVIHPYADAELVAQWEDIIVVIASQDGDIVYDGTAHKATVEVNGVPVSDESNKATVTLNGSSVTVEITDYDTDNSSITNYVKDGKVYTPEVSATYEDNTPVDSSKIRIFPVTLTIEPVEIQISSASDKKDYDGTPLTAATPEVWVGGIKQTPVLSGDNKQEVALVGEDKLTITVSGTITDVKRDPDTKEVLSVENTVDYTLSRNQDNYHISVTKGTLTVNPRPLTLTTASAAADYTGTPLTKNGEDDYTVEGLLERHKATVTITGSQTVPDSSSNTADIVIKDAEDHDVTGNYAIKEKFGTLTVNSLSGDNLVALTIAPKAATKEYDGTELTASEYELKSGALLPGDVLNVTYDGSRTEAGSGESSIKSVTVTHDGVDVTENYNIDYSAKGTLEVKARVITVTADSATKEYDTKPLTKDTASVTSGSLVEGHKLAAVEVVGSQTEVGTSKNTIKENSVKITDASSNDVTRNYAITLKDGTLEVTGKAVTDITVTAGATKVYDGTALTLTAADIKVTPALPTGYTISATFSASSRTDAGKDDVTLTGITIKDASGANVTSKYNIKVEKGTLEVTKRPLTITTGDKTKVYDGKPLTDKTRPTIDGLLKAHNMRLEFTNSQTKVGSSDNSVKVLSIYDKETNADVTKNYEITYKFGKLTVTSATGTGTGNNTSGAVQSGDNNNIWIWVILMVVAAGAAVAVILIVRKNKKNGDEQT
ncbi:MAG: hypothetical protein MSO56_05720 [Clostridiales bacterium]|nr:hypothetical protein [Clostridiales bacterium]